MKRIAYVVNDNGVDGREPTRVLYATFNEIERNVLLASDKGKARPGGISGSRQRLADRLAIVRQFVGQLADRHVAVGQFAQAVFKDAHLPRITSQALYAVSGVRP